MKCEYCNEYHKGEYGSGRFCSTKCARAFSTKDKRDLINEKIRISLTKISPDERKAAKHSYYERMTEATSLMDMSKRTMVKILKRLKLPCSYCGWFILGVVGDVHHIVEKRDGGLDTHDNLSYLCPNCHRCVHSKIIESKDLVTLEDYIGDSWKQYYYTNASKDLIEIKS
jgi:hypothetical protein